ncbi:hypothetical protein RMSM_00773 [Rhodopirellula maiorica SM1]|uniref:DUF6985 domain-containing protein n=1 Tax=Rhodopirellula maiorica SM1 TaxID=1265738 RepID=M5S3U3_9BACT|nr:hypothetical protein [Rhodopirellula maiorica]EMI22297.1 hypothetical protein RMSM_00773 [Rhodopirellula maiorica SM1]
MKKKIQIDDLCFTRDEDRGGWSCETEIKGWNGPQEVCDVVIEIDTEMGDTFSTQLAADREPSEAQIAAVKYLLENQSRIITRVLDASLRWARYFMESNEGWFDEEEVITNVSDLRENLAGLDILVSPQAVDGFAWIGFSTDCEWDEEHGLGVAVWKDTVIDVGHADVAFSTPYGGFDEILPIEEKETRENVLSSLEEQEQQAEAAYLASLPDSVKLVQAICIDDQDEVQRLKQRGAKVSDTPATFPAPIFMAIQSQSPAAVAAMIEEGASLRVKNDEGQTPEEFAQQMMDAFTMSSQMPFADPAQMKEMMSEFLGEDVGDPYQMIQETLDEIRGLGGDLADAAEEVGSMFDRLTGEDSAITPSNSRDPEPQESVESLQQILEILKQAKGDLKS